MYGCTSLHSGFFWHVKVKAVYPPIPASETKATNAVLPRCHKLVLTESSRIPYFCALTYIKPKTRPKQMLRTINEK